MNELALFEAVIALTDPVQRAALLDRECAGMPELRARLEELLAAHGRTNPLLDQPIAGNITSAGEVAIADAATRAEDAGTAIGPYKLLELIGEGGMGTVWMAEQMEPIHRRVAVKVIKAGMDSKQVLARFEAERQALALMDHPNIARVLDAGAIGEPSDVSRRVPEAPETRRLTPLGSPRPYFVMELVKGTPITKYCDDKHLTVRERLELFGDVCRAVQHAHQKGIIHRDLKPSNILVAPFDGKPVVKVIDFGVAKATGQRLTDATLFTGFGAVVGTPEYMSPEQAETNNQDIDTRSDIYALGVLLYELLTGSTPLTRKRVKEAALLEVLRVIREEEPPRPSTRLSSTEELPSISALRHTEPAKLTKLVKGELDWIVMKALEKDRGLRYETANGFAMDVQRYLADEPVLACPPSMGYRLRKFARRNKAVLTMASVIALAVLLMVGGIGWTVRDRAAREAEIARERAERQTKVATQLELIFANVDELMKEQKWDAALAMAKRAEAAATGAEIERATAQRVRALLNDLEFIDRLEQIRMQSATTIEGKFDYTGAIRAYVRAFREYGVDVEELAVEISIDRLKARRALAIPLAAALDDWVHARRALSEKDAAGWKRLVAIARGIDPETLRDRLRSTWGQPASEVKEELGRLSESIDIRAQHPATLVSMARTLRRTTQSESALRLLRDAQFVYPGDFWLNFELGLVLLKLKDYEGASRYYTAAVSLRPQAAGAFQNLGIALWHRKSRPEAIACFRKAIEFGPSAAHYSSLGHTMYEQKQLPEALAAYNKAIEIDQSYAPAYHGLGNVLFVQKKLPEAIAAYNKAVEIKPEEEIYRNLVDAHFQLGEILRSQGKLDDAIAESRQAVALQKKKATPPPQVAKYRLTLADLLNDRAWKLVSADPKPRDPGPAIELAQEATELVPNEAACWRTLGLAHFRSGNWKAAVEALEKSRQVNPHYRRESVILFILSMAHERLNDTEKARTFYDQAAQWRMGIGATEEELRRLCAEAAALLGREVPPALQDSPVATPGPTLLKPAARASLDNGSPGAGNKPHVWEFGWSDVPGATQYHLYVIGPKAKLPQINNPTLTSAAYRFQDNGYVADQNRLGWRWKVRALVNGAWTGWSEERTFDVAPLGDNKPASPKK